MNRNVRWLHGEGDRFFVISAERFGVFLAESDFSPKLVDEIPLNNQSKSDQVICVFFSSKFIIYAAWAIIVGWLKTFNSRFSFYPLFELWQNGSVGRRSVRGADPLRFDSPQE